ncbi:MAG: hypothetical protein VYE15_02850, partial [Myxococcota bacterium]|nr:hypothetical protein [Myxococcota bacterium]
PERGFWLQAESHVLLTDHAQLDSDGEPLEMEEPREAMVAPGFGVGLWYGLSDEAIGLSGMDLGLRLTHFGSGRYRRLESERPIGSRVVTVLDARWRFIERSWGGIYATVGMGWGGVRLSRELEFDLESQGNTGALEPLQQGLVMSGEVGVVWFLHSSLILRTGLGNTCWRGTLNENNGVELTRTRSLFSVGLEWAL